jgi:hypothetical protein
MTFDVGIALQDKTHWFNFSSFDKTKSSYFSFTVPDSICTAQLLHLADKQECSRIILFFFAPSKIVSLVSQENDLPFFKVM